MKNWKEDNNIVDHNLAWKDPTLDAEPSESMGKYPDKDPG